jgi:hypothetical protein
VYMDWIHSASSSNISFRYFESNHYNPWYDKMAEATYPTNQFEPELDMNKSPANLVTIAVRSRYLDVWVTIHLGRSEKPCSTKSRPKKLGEG